MTLSLYEKALAKAANPASSQSVYDAFKTVYKESNEENTYGKWGGRCVIAIVSGTIKLTIMPISHLIMSVVFATIFVVDPLFVCQEIGREFREIGRDMEDAFVGFTIFLLGDCRSLFLKQQLEYERKDQIDFGKRQLQNQPELAERLRVENQPPPGPPPPPPAGGPPPPFVSRPISKGRPRSSSNPGTPQEKKNQRKFIGASEDEIIAILGKLKPVTAEERKKDPKTPTLKDQWEAAVVNKFKGVRNKENKATARKLEYSSGAASSNGKAD